jgi:NTE family protein
MKWALVLSGGGAKGLAHAGFLAELARQGYPEPSLVTGTSMGAIMGGIYACGMDPREMRRYVLDEFDITEFLDSFAFKLNGPVGRMLQAGQLLGSLANRPGIDSGEGVLTLIRGLTGNRQFGETRIPFRCNAVDLVSGREIIFRSGKVADAIRASMSFPVFFTPHHMGKLCLVDGGIADNLPVHIPRAEGFTRILAVDVGGFKPRAASEFASAFRIVYRSFETVLYRMHQGREKNEATLTIAASNRASPMDFGRKAELVALGEQAVRDNRETLRDFFRMGRLPGRWFGEGRLKRLRQNRSSQNRALGGDRETIYWEETW